MTGYLKSLELDKIVEKAAGYAACPQAAALLREQEPLTNVEEVRFALGKTDAVNSLLLKNGSPRFSGVDGVKGIVARAVKGGVLSMAELLTVAATLRNFASLAAWYRMTEHDFLPTDDLFYALSPQPALEKAITDAILSPTEMADSASHTLFEIRSSIRRTENSIRDKLEQIVRSQTTGKFLQENVVSLRNGRYVVPVKAEYRSELTGVIHDVSSTGSTLFVEPTAVVEANARILQLRSQETAEIERILGSFSDQVAGLEPQFGYSYDAMLDIDVLLAKARLALEQKAYLPAVSDDRSFSLKRARHPLIDPARVVPVDIEMGKEYDTLVVTGPNTGGKTVSLKTTGLLCAMAQMGFLIPAHESSSVCVFGNYLVDIGDEQSIEQSLSTFSGHMKKITAILAEADRSSLVLLDELGAGTDPAEGAALAVSVIEQLRSQGALVMATTHYSEMKVFALETPGVVNASCEFDLESLRPTYKLSVGVPGKSNAFLISEKLGLPQNVIQTARRHLNEDDKRLDSVLAQLDDLKLKLKASQEEAERQKDAAAQALEKAKKKSEALEKQAETELEAARLKARQMIQQVQSEAYALTEELRKIQKDEQTSAAQRAAQARQIARRDAEKLFDQSDVVHRAHKEFVPLKEVRVGQEVVIAEFDQLATVTALPDKNGMVAVRAGILKTKVPLQGLRAPDKFQKPAKKKLQPRPAPRTTVDRAERNASMELNLLGMTVEEALMEVDQFIDHAVMTNQNVLYLIHGKGTGALRSAIQAHLKGHRNVKSFRLGRYGEGEAGVTVVELK